MGFTEYLDDVLLKEGMTDNIKDAPYIDVKGVTGDTFRAIFIDKEKTKKDGDTVRFFDIKRGIPGQFVSSYYVSTLLDDDDSISKRGLDLMGYEPAWKINAEEITKVLDWLKDVDSKNIMNKNKEV